MVGRKSVCLRRLAGGRRREIVRFGRFLSNPRVTVERLIEGWGVQTAPVLCGGVRGAPCAGAPGHQRVQLPHPCPRAGGERRRGGAAWARSARASAGAFCCMRCWRWTRTPTAVWGWCRATSGPGRSRFWRLVVVASATLILCSCRQGAALRDCATCGPATAYPGSFTGAMGSLPALARFTLSTRQGRPSRPWHPLPSAAQYPTATPSLRGSVAPRSVPFFRSMRIP